MNKRFIGTLVGIILAVAGFFYFTQPAEETAGAVSNHTLGSSPNEVVLIEYGDFQCPACGQYHPILQQLKEQYKDRVVFQFRHFPLEAIHVNARASSRAAEAAGLQGKFWEMHDILFENQNAWSESNDPVSIFEGYAREIGLDVTRFSSDYRSSTVNATINADLAAGKALGVDSTPTFVLDGQRLTSNPNSIEAFATLLDEAIAKKSGQSSDDKQTNSTPSSDTSESQQ